MKGLIIVGLLFVVIIYVLTIHINSDELQKYYMIDKSKIHGLGCFAKQDLPEYLDMGVITVHTYEGVNRLRDPSKKGRIFYTKDNIPWREHRLLGRYTNHSETPNCEVYKSSPMTFGMRTIKKIKQGDELLVDYYPIRSVYMDGDMSDLNI